MSEKNMVTIDSELTIPKEEKKVFENQHILLKAGIKCRGGLLFKNCTIEPRPAEDNGNKPGYIDMGLDGNLEMDGCQIIHPGPEFLRVGYSKVDINHTEFQLRLPPSFNIASIESYMDDEDDEDMDDEDMDDEDGEIIEIIEGLGKVEFSDCHFTMEETETESENEPDLYLLDIANRKAVMKKCTFQNVPNIHAKTITKCTFVGCKSIECTEISSSKFKDCGVIEAVCIEDDEDEDEEESGRGCIKNCTFTRIIGIQAIGTDIQNCKFQTIENDTPDTCKIYVEDCKLIRCSFKDIDLKQNSYLIIMNGYPFGVEDCEFTNCRTDREDSKLYEKQSVIENRIREQEKRERKKGGLLKGVLQLAGSVARTAGGAAVAVAQEMGDMDKFQKRYDAEWKKLQRERRKQK